MHRADLAMPDNTDNTNNIAQRQNPLVEAWR